MAAPRAASTGLMRSPLSMHSRSGPWAWPRRRSQKRKTTPHMHDIVHMLCTGTIRSHRSKRRGGSRNSAELRNLALISIHCAPGDLDLANILVVDDDPAVRMTIQLLLERAGHGVVVADDGRKGLAAFRAGDFDLLF